MKKYLNCLLVIHSFPWKGSRYSCQGTQGFDCQATSRKNIYSSAFLPKVSPSVTLKEQQHGATNKKWFLPLSNMLILSSFFPDSNLNVSSKLKATFVVRSPEGFRKRDQREAWWNIGLLLYYLVLYF